MELRVELAHAKTAHRRPVAVARAHRVGVSRLRVEQALATRFEALTKLGCYGHKLDGLALEPANLALGKRDLRNLHGRLTGAAKAVLFDQRQGLCCVYRCAVDVGQFHERQRLAALTFDLVHHRQITAGEQTVGGCTELGPSLEATQEPHHADERVAGDRLVAE